MGKEKKVSKCPVKPLGDRIVIVATNLVPKSSSKIVRSESASSRFIFRVVAVRDGIGSFAIDDLVVVKIQEGEKLPGLPFDLKDKHGTYLDYVVMDTFKIIAKVDPTSVEEGSTRSDNSKAAKKILTPQGNASRTQS